MSKILYLLTLTLMSAALCSKSSLQYLESIKDNKGATEFLKAFFDGLQVFNDIPCPASCEITDDQSARLMDDIFLIESIINKFFNDPEDWWQDLPMFKEKVTDLYNLYLELSPSCFKAYPAVKERFWEIERHVVSLEYIPKLAIHWLFNYQKLEDQLIEAIRVCVDKKHPDIVSCGKGLGLLLYDVWLWDFKPTSQLALIK
jgi:hypothetical protein